MSRWNEREIARKLAERDDIEPPEGLLEKIKSEIPPVVNVGPRAVGENVRPFPPLPASREPRPRKWLLAASLVATLGGGLIALQVMQRTPRMGEEAEAPVQQDEAMSDAAPAWPEAEPLTSQAAPETADAGNAADAADAADTAFEAHPMPKPQAGAREDRREEAQDLEALGSVRRRAAASTGAPAAKEEGGAAARQAKPEWSVDGLVITDRDQDSEDFEAFESMQVLDEVEDEIDVTAESPVLDQRRISTGATVSQTELEKIPALQPAPEPVSPPPPAAAPAAPAEVEGGVEGGVVGGVVGGVAGGIPGGVVKEGVVLHEAPLRVGTPPGADERFRDNVFQAVGTNPFTATEKDRLSTFGLDVDTASYTVARRFLREGKLPDPASVRVEEFVNFFDYGDPAPARGEFALRAEGAPTPFAPADHRLLRFNLRAREVRAESRQAAVLTFVVDVSGSMNQQNRLGLVKQSLGLLLDQLRPADRVGLVVYGDNARAVLPPTSDREAIRQAVEALAAEGATNAEAGLALGYDMARRSFRPGAINRVILCSDGVANVGATGPQAILERIGREARQGIELTTLGFGMGSYNDVLMEQLADKGDGRYAYIDGLEEARRVLVDELSGTLQTVAKDAKAQVEFDPRTVASWRLLGYENRLLAHEQFRDNTVDAGEIGAGHSVTALYEVELRPGASGKVATFRLRFRVPGTGEMRETVQELQTSDLAPSWDKAPRGLRLASLVAELAEVLKGAPTAKGGDLNDVLRRSRRLVAELSTSAQGPDVAEFARLAARAARLKRQGVGSGGD